MPSIQVTSTTDKISPKDRIDQLLALSEGAVKLRIPILMYDRDQKTYQPIPEAYWLLSLPKQDTTVDTIEEVVEAVKAAMVALGELGPTEVIARLSAPKD